MSVLGILVCGEFSEEIAAKYPGKYEDFFIKTFAEKKPEITCKTYRVYLNEFPDSVNACDAWLITGSKFGVYEEYEWIKNLLSFTKKAYDANKIVVGVCFGHQALAQALGGRVVKASQGWGLGLQRYDVLQPFGSIEGPYLDLYAIHQDQVVELPEDATVLIKTVHCPNAGLLYKKKAVSFQPHPEFNVQFEQDLIESINGQSFSKELGEAALKSLSGSRTQSDDVMSYIADFIVDQ